MQILPLAANGRLGLHEAILISGGASRFANLKKVSISRVKGSGRVQFTVDVDKIRKGQADDVPLANWDLITIPQKGFGVNRS